MGRRATFTPYRPKTILNKHKRADHWFWTRYSAYPYIGCQHGCEFCYCREEKYYPYTDVHDFAYVIKVKENAPELLRRALSRATASSSAQGSSAGFGVALVGTTLSPMRSMGCTTCT